jgi:hypothetical protein
MARDFFRGSLYTAGPCEQDKRHLLLSFPLSYLCAPSRLCGSHQMCFLDVVSINQADPELMQRGIYGLGGLSCALLCSLAPFTLRSIKGKG